MTCEKAGRKRATGWRGGRFVIRLTEDE